MRKIVLVVIILFVAVTLLFLMPAKVAKGPTKNNHTNGNTVGAIHNMTIESSAFVDDGKIPSTYTCDGKNINPEILIAGVPEDAVSLVLIVYDPDVPKSIRADGIWTHWLVWNILADTKKISEGEEPPGVVGENTGGEFGYQGPCPPSGEHRYFFKLYALDSRLNLSEEGTTKNDIEEEISNHIIAQSELVGRYSR